MIEVLAVSNIFLVCMVRDVLDSEQKISDKAVCGDMI